MRDEDNKNITYKQINTLFIIIEILVIAILIMALAYATLTLVANIIDVSRDGSTPGKISSIIWLCVLEVFLIYSLTINLVVAIKEFRMTIDEHLLLFTILTYFSLNIPCAVILTKRMKNKDKE